nr:ribonuclease H-like domain-containing protein [Tanacetum cinerariifolium]
MTNTSLILRLTGIDESKFIYGPKQSKNSESDAKTSDHASCESNSSVETLESVPKLVESKPKAVCGPKVWFDAPIIEEYESDSDDEYVFKAIVEQEIPSCTFINTVKHVKSTRQTVKDQDTCSQNPKDNPYYNLKEKGSVDSGCSRHMTRNKAYLIEYQDFNGGSVAFGGSNGQITDKENVVLSGGLACLITKATVDESNKWHRRMTTPVLLVIKESNTRPPPVTAENKANKTASPKEANNSAKAKNGDQKLNEDTGSKTNKEPVNQDNQAFLEELERLKRQAKEADNAAKTLRKTFSQVNTASTPVNTASPSRNASAAKPSYPDLLTYANQDDSQIPILEDIYEVPNDRIFTSASYDGEGVVADFINLESTVNIEPKNISQALKDKSWVDAMLEELLQFKTQQVWILVHLPFGKKVDVP